MSYPAILVGVMSIVTILLRALPFLVLGKDKDVPPVITYLGEVLPKALIGMLVVYCLRETDFAGASHGIPEMISAAAVVLLQIWKRNAILSILGGTAIYMVLIQTVF